MEPERGPPRVIVVCPKCGAKNENATTCVNCRTKLPVIDSNYINEMIATSSSTVQSDGTIKYERTTKVDARFDPGISDGKPHIIVKCQKCGKKNRDAKFCKKCGAVLPDPDMMKADAENISRRAELLRLSPGTTQQFHIAPGMEPQPRMQPSRLVDPIKMAEMMGAAGFENVQISSEYKGFRFQIVAEGKLGLLNLPVLVKIIDKLDEQSATKIAEEYSALRKHSPLSLTLPHFLYVIIAGDLAGGSKEMIALRIAGGLKNMTLVPKYNASILLVADGVSKEVYPKKSSERYVNRIREIIVKLLN
jgi:ribosomal protein L32